MAFELPTKIFAEGTAQKFVPNVLRRSIGAVAWRINSDVLFGSGRRGQFGVLETLYENYPRGCKDKRSGFRIEPGESCLTLHLGGIERHRSGADAVRSSLGQVARYAEGLATKPDHIVGVSYVRLIDVAATFGFTKFVPNPNIFSIAYSATVHTARSRNRKLNYSEPGGQIAIAHMPAAEFIERYHDYGIPTLAVTASATSRAEAYIALEPVS